MFYIKINAWITFKQQTNIIQSFIIRSEAPNNLKTLAYTLSHKERRIGKLKSLVVIQNTQRTFPPKGRTTILLPPLPRGFFFLLIIKKTTLINFNQNQTLHLGGSRQELHSKSRYTVSQRLNKTSKFHLRQIITSFR